MQAFFDFVDTDTQGFRLVFESDLMGEPQVARRVEQATEACVDACRVPSSRTTRDSDPYRARILAVGLVARASSPHGTGSSCGGGGIPKEEAVDTTVALAWGGLSHVPCARGDQVVGPPTSEGRGVFEDSAPFAYIRI